MMVDNWQGPGCEAARGYGSGAGGRAEAAAYVRSLGTPENPLEWGP
jgi:hypothetical protein